MEVECSPLNWGYCHPEEGLMEELKHSLVYTTLELETTIVSAKEEIARREVEIIHLKDVLSRTLKERNDAQTKCQKLMLDNLLLQQQTQQKQEQKQKQKYKQEVALPSGSASSSEDESKSGDSNKHFTSSDSTKNFAALSPGISDPIIPQQQQQQQQQPLLPETALDKLAAGKPLPEIGKLLKAVMEAGPLLQTLLLAGPLPQWQHPPPQLDSFEIPPVAISSPSPRLLHQDSFNSASTLKKRGLELNEASDSPPNKKYQKVCAPLIITNT